MAIRPSRHPSPRQWQGGFYYGDQDDGSDEPIIVKESIQQSLRCPPLSRRQSSLGYETVASGADGEGDADVVILEDLPMIGSLCKGMEVQVICFDGKQL